MSTPSRLQIFEVMTHEFPVPASRLITLPPAVHQNSAGLLAWLFSALPPLLTLKPKFQRPLSMSEQRISAVQESTSSVNGCVGRE
jgi:hypothetical protein